MRCATLHTHATYDSPYSTQQIREWRAAGYFTGASKVDVRQKQAPGAAGAPPAAPAAASKSNADDLMDDLADSDDEQVGCAPRPSGSSGTGTETEGDWKSSDDVDWAAFV